MDVTVRAAYENMFLALDAAWDEGRSEELGRYLSDANPFLWEDGRSADPAVWDDFEKRFIGAFPQGCSDARASWIFVNAYLLEISMEYRAMVQADASCSEENLSEVFSRVVPVDVWEATLRKGRA